MKFPGYNVSLSPTLPLLPNNGATIYDQESMLTSNHEDSDVPQQCARTRSLLFFYIRNKDMNSLFGSRMTFCKDYKMKIIYILTSNKNGALKIQLREESH